MPRAFTLVDVLVTLTVIAVLIGLLLPTLSGVRETTRQVVCRSNVRQHGFGLAMFADDHQDKLPPSQYVTLNAPQRTVQVRQDDTSATWDGLGNLYSEGYLPAIGVFYCPSHNGSHPQYLYESRWDRAASELPPEQREIITNYQYRGATVLGVNTLTGLHVRLPRAAIVTDALRTQTDFNHGIGANVLRADLSVNWYPDPVGRLSANLPAAENEADAADKVANAWDQLDHPPSPEPAQPPH